MELGVLGGIRVFVLVLLVFVCVIGHEISHSLVSKFFGIPVPHITLYPMGGVATMERIPRNPAQEISIALAGPFFNFGIAAILYLVLERTLGHAAVVNPTLTEWSGVWVNLLWINPVLGVFNLIPAFPMDGGRVFRAFLAFWMPYVRATRISVFMGQFFAILFFLLGVWRRHLMLVLVAVYVFKAASDEWRFVNRDHAATTA